MKELAYKGPSIVVMAGGSGTRFWPISRTKLPKQFLPLGGGQESLIQATVRRVKPLLGERPPVIVTNSTQVELVNKHVPGSEILVEPEARGTAASIGYAAIITRMIDPNAVMVVLPSDHAVNDDAKLLSALQEAITLAKRGDHLVTLGIRPTGPNTAYGYIQRGDSLGGRSFLVRRFFEKPNLERAEQYVESGQFFWNSGMFIWRVDTILKAIEEYMPALYQGLLEIEAASGRAETVAKVFSSLEPIQIDIGVMEHARNCAVVIGDSFGWNDVGSWDAWAQDLEKDARKNTKKGDALLIDSRDCIVYSDKRLIAVVGGEGLVVIDAGDAVLVCPRDKVQEVKQVVAELKKQGRPELV